MPKATKTVIDVHGTPVAILTQPEGEYISLTDMLKAKDGEFFISDWLRNRNTIEFLGIWERVHNPDFNYGEFATIRSQAGLHSSWIIHFRVPVIESILFLGVSERVNNPGFNPLEFEGIRTRAGRNSFVLTPRHAKNYVPLNQFTA